MATTAVKIFVIIWIISKWIVYRLNFMAVLLYYGEKGIELPSKEAIQEYRAKALKKDLGLK